MNEITHLSFFVNYSAVYRRALSEGASDVAYGRVMFVGAGGVGKSCFKRGLMSLPFNPQTDSTILADIQSVRPADTDKGSVGQQRPLSRAWVMGSCWSEVTEQDEIQELAQLLVLVGKQGSSRGAASQSSSSSSREQSNLERMMESKILLKAFVKAEELKASGVNQQLECSPFFHLWDCGGQPVFLEVLPIFLTSRTIFLLFFNAANNLELPFESIYHKDGQKFIEGKVNMSTLELMERWIALIYSHLLKKDQADPGYPRVIPIGTRGDELKARGQDPDEVLKVIDDSFKEKAGLRHVMIKPVIVDNTTSGRADSEDPGFERVRKDIFGITSSDLKKRTPISWILFRKLLQLYITSQKCQVNIISLQDAYDVSAIAKVQPDHVQSVLSFYHELGVLLYYPNIAGLKQKVILNPKWFVECLGKVLTLPRVAEEEYNLKGEWELLRSKGILVQRLYTNVWSKCQGVEPDQLIELLIHFQLAVQVQVKSNEYFDRHSKQYFVPAVLPYTVSTPKIANSPINIAPLHVTFTAGFIIPGFFTRLATTMLKERDNNLPKLSLSFNNGIYHNQVTYEIESFLAHFITLTEQSNTIQINFTCSSDSEVRTVCANLKV